jgi:hypothetical protein
MQQQPRKTKPNVRQTHLFATNACILLSRFIFWSCVELIFSPDGFWRESSTFFRRQMNLLERERVSSTKKMDLGSKHRRIFSPGCIFWSERSLCRSSDASFEDCSSGNGFEMHLFEKSVGFCSASCIFWSNGWAFSAPDVSGRKFSDHFAALFESSSERPALDETPGWSE